MEKFESIVRSHFATLLVLVGLGMVTVKSTEGGSVGQETSVIRFTEHLIWSDYTYNYGICAADIDGDGDPDLTSADAGGNNALYWFENDGRGNFRRHFITRKDPHRPERHRVADINRDGRLDVVIVENFFGDVKWYENPGDFRPGVLWKRHYISKGGLLGAYDLDIADIDQDGFPGRGRLQLAPREQFHLVCPSGRYRAGAVGSTVDRHPARRHPHGSSGGL